MRGGGGVTGEAADEVSQRHVCLNKSKSLGAAAFIESLTKRILIKRARLTSYPKHLDPIRA